MGCDIHCWAEKRVEGKWVLVTPQKGDASWSEFYNEKMSAMDWESENDASLHKARVDIGRNYDAFAILADVRNGRGFAGVKTGDGFRPILAERRGWPKDRSPLLESEDAIEHSPSWLTLRELNEYDWTQRTGQLGVVSLPEYVEWRDKRPHAAPEHYCGGISGKNRETLSPKDADNLLHIGERTIDGWTKRGMFYDPPAGHPATYVEVAWGETYSVAAGAFYEKTLPNLNEIAKREGAAADDFRIVFYFDS